MGLHVLTGWDPLGREQAIDDDSELGGQWSADAHQISRIKLIETVNPIRSSVEQFDAFDTQCHCCGGERLDLSSGMVARVAHNMLAP